MLIFWNHMTESNEIAYLCGICGQHCDHLPTAGVIHTNSMTFPIRVCPDCGPFHREVMQICRELTLGILQN